MINTDTGPIPHILQALHGWLLAKWGLRCTRHNEGWHRPDLVEAGHEPHGKHGQADRCTAHLDARALFWRMLEHARLERSAEV